MRILLISFFYLFNSPFIFQNAESIYVVERGKISFKSDAPLELIQASSEDLAGIINTENHTFAFTIPLNSFDGFNSALQKEHFRENYMETHKFPTASFKGKMIELIDFTKNGEYAIRAKGILNIHGEEKERIIKCQLKILDNKFSVEASFSVYLQDHNIQIPKVVYQKIAEEIFLDLNVDFIQR